MSRDIFESLKPISVLVGGAEVIDADPAAPDAVFGSMVFAPAILSRNAVRYVRCRTWRAKRKKDDMQTMNEIKRTLPAAIVAGITDDLHMVGGALFGEQMFASVVPIACGHSKRPDCLSCRLAVELAERLGVPMVKAFADRFIEGSRHPKENKKLPPLELVEPPPAPALVVDDIATSGFHMEEALTRLRDAGIACAGLVWVSGVKQG